MVLSSRELLFMRFYFFDSSVSKLNIHRVWNPSSGIFKAINHSNIQLIGKQSVRQDNADMRVEGVVQLYIKTGQQTNTSIGTGSVHVR